MSPIGNVVIACAGLGSRLGMGMPKALLTIGQKTILQRLLAATASIPHCRVVVGYQEEAVIQAVLDARSDAVIVRNPAFMTTSTLTSLRLASAGLEGKTLYVDGDLIIRTEELARFLQEAAEVPALLGYSPASSENPVYIHLDEGRVVRFSRIDPSEHEWTSVFACPPGLLRTEAPSTDSREGSVFEWLARWLPLAASAIPVLEIDTPADYDRVVARVSGW